MTPPISIFTLWRSFRRLFSVLLLLVLIALGTGAAIMVQAGRSDLQPADAAIVMLDDQRGTTARLDRVRQLYTDGRISRILLAGAGSGASRAWLQGRGVKEEALIELDGAGQVAQLAAAKAALDQERLRSTLLIAEPVETLRLLKIAHDDNLRPLSAPIGEPGGLNMGDVAREIGRYFRYVMLNR